MELIPIFAIIGSFTMVILIVWFATRAKTRRAELQAEVQSKLIDRFGSTPEMIDFLKSNEGRQFVMGVQSVPAVLTRERILSGLTRAIVMTALGAAFLGLTFFYDDDFAVPAAILFCLGLGYLVATVVSYKLSGSFHVEGVPQDREAQ